MNVSKKIFSCVACIFKGRLMKLDKISVKNYANIITLRLRDLGDLNIIIGPNNCGKTNLLRAIHKLRTAERGYVGLESKERYQGRDVTIKYKSEDRELTLQSEDSVLVPEQRDEELEKLDTLYCEEGRLQQYGGKDPGEWLAESYPREHEKKLQQIIKETVDSHVLGISGPRVGMGEKVRFTWGWKEEERDEFELDDHGSGMRSLTILLADIWRHDPDVILLDEPEVGLNPAAKRRFLQLLLGELSEDSQIFIATQDSSFVNPIFWKDSEKEVSIFHYSVSKESFRKVEADKGPSFAGYLPQSTTLKDVHLYVEGKQDFNAFQAFLHRYASIFDRRGNLLSRIGIYNLGGDLWEHFLSTVPDHPYLSVVILNGGKEEDAERVVERFREGGYQNLPSFAYCEELGEVGEKFGSEEEVPVYCLDKQDMKEYVGVDKKEKIPSKAWEIDSLPEEIEKIFDSFFMNEEDIYQTKFSDPSSIEDWNKVAGDKWRIEDNELHQPEEAGNRVIILKEPKIKNGVFEASVNSIDGKAAQHLIWRSDGGVQSNYYLFGTGNLGENPEARFGFFKDGGEAKWREREEVDIKPNEFHRYRVEFAENRHRMYLDDEMIFRSGEKALVTAGFVGFHCGSHTSVRDVNVKEINLVL